MSEPLAPLVDAVGLRKRFVMGDTAIEVLRGVDLRVERGERVAVVGQSGVGKSTLLHILGTLDRPSGGSLRIDGEDAFARPPEEIARLRNRRIGFVFQFHHLLPEFDALENVMMPGLIRGIEREEMRERAAAMLRDVGLEHRLRHRVGKLSGGERQRVALARAVVLEPELVLADEPTGNLDPKTGEQIEDLLLERNRTRGTTLIVVTHNEALAAKLGREVELVDGVVQEHGGAVGALRRSR
jgi:lipoprotein-releasing system ATP-binding protein